MKVNSLVLAVNFINGRVWDRRSSQALWMIKFHSTHLATARESGFEKRKCKRLIYRN